jgi:hypothetical protein
VYCPGDMREIVNSAVTRSKALPPIVGAGGGGLRELSRLGAMKVKLCELSLEVVQVSHITSLNDSVKCMGWVHSESVLWVVGSIPRATCRCFHPLN